MRCGHLPLIHTRGQQHPLQAQQMEEKKRREAARFTQRKCARLSKRRGRREEEGVGAPTVVTTHTHTQSWRSRRHFATVHFTFLLFPFCVAAPSSVRMCRCAVGSGGLEESRSKRDGQEWKAGCAAAVPAALPPPLPASFIRLLRPSHWRWLPCRKRRRGGALQEVITAAARRSLKARKKVKGGGFGHRQRQRTRHATHRHM